jgi:ABC-2 type transport system ATP-binding protein
MAEGVSALTLTGVSKRLGHRQVLRGVDLTLAVGESLAIVGPNGSGKSTLLRMITGVLRPDHGSVMILGEQGALARRHVGYLPHDAPIYPATRVDRFLAHLARLRGVRRRVIASQVEWAMEVTACTEVAGRLGGQLSRGYRQRVGLAAALVHKPEVLVLDEPFTALDTSVLTDVRRVLQDWTGGGSLLVASHPHPDLARVCERQIRIDDGTLASIGGQSDA